MYTEQDYQDITALLKRRMLWVVIPGALLLAGLILCLIRREAWGQQFHNAEFAKIVAIALTLALGAAIIFFQGLLVAPVAAYRRHLDGVLHLRTRQTTGAFKEMEPTPVTRDGVRFYPLLLNVGKMTEPEDDRLFYYDANLPLPDWQVGQRITVTAHDKALGAWEIADE